MTGLPPGTRIGPYEVAGALGAGGMGEVYRARDARLSRDVAIKMLPDALAHDAERVARFEREARLLASLSHPNIGGIHGLEEADGRRYLILEFIEGETLAQRLRRGALPIREAMTTCRAIAAALEAAHESGVIHRDLKPGNVMIRADGEVKVLDFGLAKGAAAGASGDAGLSASPTMTYAATGVGVVLGTAAYMSPEQARGKTVDRRTDIWSFGCVLYECLSGRQAFEGETISDVIARILEREPDWGVLPPGTPATIRDLLQRCLDKDAKQRLRDIGDARLTLDREISGVSTLGRPPAAGVQPAKSGRSALIAGLAIGLAVGAALWTGISGRVRSPGGASGRATHVSIVFPEDPRIVSGKASPDASVLVLLGVPVAEQSLVGRGGRLYARRLDGFDLLELPGTDGVSDFRFTPDSRSVLLRCPIGPGTTEERLARMPVDGSAPPVTVAPWNPAWNSFAVLSTGEIVMLDLAGSHLFRMPAGGGEAREITLKRSDVRATMRLGEVLPRDRGVFVTAGVYRDRGWAKEAGVVDLRDDRLVMLNLHGGNAACLDATTLVYSLGQVLLAVPFDLDKLQARGASTAVATGLRADFSYSPGDFFVISDGTLAYVPGGEVGNTRRLGIVDLAGKLRVLPAEANPYQGWPSPSRAGSSFAIRVTSAQGIDEIWIGDRDRPTLRRLVAWPRADCASVMMSPDGRTVAYARIGRDRDDGVYLVDVNGAGPGRLVARKDSATVDIRPEAWSPDGAWLTISRSLDGTHNDLLIGRVAPGRDSLLSLAPLVVTPYEESATDFSRDGRWFSYASNETGRPEIRVAPFRPDGTLGAPTQVTVQGGQFSEWLPDGHRIAVRELSKGVVRIFDLGSPPGSAVRPLEEWFNMDSLGVLDGAMLEDGSMIVVLRGRNEQEGVRAVNLVFGWRDEIRRRLAK